MTDCPAPPRVRIPQLETCGPSTSRSASLDTCHIGSQRLGSRGCRGGFNLSSNSGARARLAAVGDLLRRTWLGAEHAGGFSFRRKQLACRKYSKMGASAPAESAFACEVPLEMRRAGVEPACSCERRSAHGHARFRVPVKVRRVCRFAIGAFSILGMANRPGSLAAYGVY